MPEPQIAHQDPLVAPSNHLPVAGLHDAGASARGQSAELLAADKVLECGKTPPVEGTPTVNPVTEDQLNLISNLYQMIIEQQVRAINNVQASVKQEAPPSLEQAMIETLGAAALGGAAGVIGGLIGAAAARFAQSRKASSKMVQAVSDGMTDLVKGGLQEALKQGGQMIAAETEDPVERFFRTQVNALVEVSDQQRIAFDETQRAVIRSAPQPNEEAQALIDALKQTRTSAYICQREHIVDAWVTAQAQKSVGITANAVALAKGEAGQHIGTFLGDETADPGADFVLSVEVRLDEPGGEVAIESARMEGANRNTRNLIANRRLPSLDIPFVVHANTPAGTVKVGRNEGGLIWNRSDAGGNTWLGRRAKIEENKPGNKSNADDSGWVPPVMQTFMGTTLVLHPVYEKDFNNGARILIENDMKDLAISPDRIA